MSILLDWFNRLTLAAKIATAIAAIGIPAALAVLFRGPAVWVILAGAVLVGAALAVYSMILAAGERRKASPMYKALAGNAAAAPIGITEPARRARLDDLRRNFESGVEKFRAAGKNVYALPWYAVVGEPGSGKTEAIRHCNVGFPPGLQDQLQGAGGTLNMNWWFTNHAVILDTAGRLMFEEVEPGTTSEWQEFLKLLRRYRPSCPINGMLLVIPAESLIRDTSDAIERKAGKVAQQLDVIQRALGVRFPVFVVITKCDLINGFREFFDEINEPTLQHQIFGWSNPAPLDAPFNPELVEDHLRTVQQRLVRRRAGLMLDPVNTENPAASRLEQMDALYAFPESLTKLGPRLKRYLETIFVAGEWSQKPLFLRGIYFTSAMREGAALDAELAQALGVPVESLPEGRVWQRERAFFLRDLFMSKVFRERGLVTRAVSTSRLQRARRLALLGTAGGGLLALGLLTWFGYRELARSIVEPSKFWAEVSDAYTRAGLSERSADLDAEEFYLPIVQRKNAGDSSWGYRGRDEEPFKNIPADRGVRSIAKFPQALRGAVTATVDVPWVFRPIALQGNLLAAERAAAARVLIEGSVIRPLVNAAEVRLRRENDESVPWSPEATEALAQLIRLEVSGLPGARGAVVDLDPLLRFAVKGGDDDARRASEDMAALKDAVRWFYSSESGGSWPPASLVDSRRAEIDAAVEGGVKRFVSAWESLENAPVTAGDTAAGPSVGGGGAGDGGTAGGGFAKVQSLLASLEEFSARETELLALRSRAASREPGNASVLDDFTRRTPELAQIGSRISASLDVLGGAAGSPRRTLRQAFKSELASFRAQARRQHEALLEELKPIAPGPDGKTSPVLESAQRGRDKDRAQMLAVARESVEKSLEESVKDSKRIADAMERVDELDAQFLNGSPDPAFRRRLKLYESVAANLKPPPPPAALPPGTTRAALQSISASADVELKELGAASRPDASGDPAAREIEPRAREVCAAIVEAAAASRRTGVVAAFLDQVRAGNSGPGVVGDLAAQLVQSKGPEAWFNPGAAAKVLADFLAVRRLLAPPGPSQTPSVFGAADLARRFDPLDRSASEYLRAFADYWSKGDVATPTDPPGGWAQVRAGLGQAGSAPAPGLPVLESSPRPPAEELLEAIDRDVLTSADKDEVDRLAREWSRGLSVQRSDAFRARCDEILRSWSALPPAGGEARAKFLAACAGGQTRSYVMTPASEPEGGPTAAAKRHWLEFSRRGVRALAKEEGAAAAKAIARLKALGFPFGPPGSEMDPAELESSRKACEFAASVVVGASGGAQIAPSGDTQIDADIASMRRQDAVSSDDERAIERARQILGSIGSGDLKCTVTVLPNEPATRGAGRMNEYLPDLALNATGRPPDRTVSIYDGGNQQIAELATPSGPFEIQAYDRNQPDKKAVVPIPTRWGGLGLLSMPNVKREGGGLSYKVELLMPYNGNGYSLWLRLDFSRPLPKDWP